MFNVEEGATVGHTEDEKGKKRTKRGGSFGRGILFSFMIITHRAPLLVITRHGQATPTARTSPLVFPPPQNAMAAHVRTITHIPILVPFVRSSPAGGGYG
jgi:hypothetical protein